MMIKSTLVAICLVLGCWSQLTLAQSSNCQVVRSFQYATRISINQYRSSPACARLEFQGGSLEITNSESGCANTKISAVNMDGRKIADLCGSQVSFSSSARFYLELNIGGSSFLSLFLNYRPGSNNNVVSSTTTRAPSTTRASSTTRAPSASTTTNAQPITNANTRTCGRPAIQPSISRIVGGSPAVPNSYPWQVLLNMKQDGNTYMCGGSLIDENTVVTAAHCIDGMSNPRDVTVFAGIHYSRNRGSGIVVSKIIGHEDYDSDSLQNDIALLKLSSPVQFGTTISPVCLPTSDLSDSTKFGIVTGWGGINYNGTITGSELMQVKIPVFPSQTRCGRAYVNTKTQFCGGTNSTRIADVKDSCFGDSGGPVVVRDNTNDPFVLHGVVSYGETDVCNGNGIYTRVFNYLRWISLNR